ncbi:MAG TPA: hypothetical protein VFI29_17565, partial [Hanamia sp.]|nr:hypothetical protein [Hanamia sp.]
IPCLLNKAPSGGLYTPAERRVRQADCHHLYNYESGFHYPNSRDTLCPELLLKPAILLIVSTSARLA